MAGAAFKVHPLAFGGIAQARQGEGVVLLAVDNLPAELPCDSSTFFSGQFRALLPNILSADFAKPLEETGLSPEVKRAVIVHRGELTPAYSYLKEYL